MIETTSRKHVKNGGHEVRGRVSKSFKIGPSMSFYETKCLFKIWTNEAIQQELSAVGRKQNIWQNIATKIYHGGYKHTALNKLHKKFFSAKDSANTVNTVSLLNA